MTQSPYTPPSAPYPMNYSGYYAPGVDLLAPARRASILMYVLGGLVVLGGFCCVGVSQLMPLVEKQNPQALSQLQTAMPGMTLDMIKMAYVVMGVLCVVGGGVVALLGRFVRKGRTPPIIISIVLSSLVLLFLLLNILSALFQLRGPNAAPVLLGMCVILVPVVLFGILLRDLIQAMRAAGQVRALEQQYAMQYWQYQQQQQAYSQGYAATPQQQPPAQGYAAPQQPYPASPPPTPPGGPDAPSSQG